MCEVSGEPRDRPFDHPAVSAELLAGLDTLASDAHFDPASADPLLEFGMIVDLVRMELVGFAATRSSTGPDRRNCLHQWLERVGVVGVRGRDNDREGQALPVGRDVDLRTGLAALVH